MDVAATATAAGSAVIRADVAVCVRGLRKRFGTHEVLRGLDWEVPTGRMLGLLGRNGAGKTTLLRCLLGLSPHDGGSVEIFGEPMTEPGGERMHRIGFVPQTFDLFPWMRVRAYLDFTAAFYPRWDRALCERLLDTWEIDRKQKIGQLSQGQRQKLAIVRALAPDPDLLVLDEPVASLDPQARRAFMRALLEQARRPGKTVIFSTHITADLERADADIALLKDGRIVFESTLEGLRSRLRRAVFARAGGWTNAPAFPGMLRSSRSGDELHAIVDSVDDGVLAAFAAQAGATLAVEPLNLEEAFVELA